MIYGVWTSVAETIFEAVDAEVGTQTTTARLAPYVNEAVNINGDGGNFIIEWPVTLSEFWYAFDVFATTWDGAATAGNLFYLLGGAFKEPIMAVNNTASGIPTLYLFDGSSFGSSIATSGVSIPNDTRIRLDIHVKMHDTLGVIEVYKDQELMMSFSGDTNLMSHITGVGAARHFNPRSASTYTYAHSGMILADEDTRGMILHEAVATAAGATSSWTGSYTGIAETGIDDTDIISSNAANQVGTFVMEDVHADLAYYEPVAVVLTARAQRGSGPQTIQGVARIGSTDYTQALEGTIINLTYSGHCVVFDESPATTDPWTLSEIAAAEFGLKSIA